MWGLYWWNQPVLGASLCWGGRSVLRSLCWQGQPVLGEMACNGGFVLGQLLKDLCWGWGICPEGARLCWGVRSESVLRDFAR